MPQSNELNEVKVNMGAFALLVRTVKKEAGLSNKAIARAVHVRPATVTEWINEQSEPTMERRGKIERILRGLLEKQIPAPEPEAQSEPAPVDEAEPVLSAAPKQRMRSLLPEDRRWNV